MRVRVLVLPAVCLVVAVKLMAAEKAAPAKATPAEAQALLDKAVSAIETQGELKALAAFNDPKGGFRDRELYVFCLGPDGKITASVDPKMIGTDETAVKGPDGREIGKEIATVGSQGGGSLEYQWKNPVSGKVETKVSYIKRAGAQTCGVGAYK